MTIDYQRGKIYIIVNDVNDIIYVGSTAVPRLCTRMVQHRSCSKKPDQMSNFYTAMRTLGTDHFRIVLDHVFPCNSKDELVAEEMKTLDAHIAAGKSAYNMRTANGWIVTPETRAKMAAAQIGRVHTDETKRKIAATHMGAVFTDEHKRNIAKAKLGQGFTYGCIAMYTDKTGLHRWTFNYEKTRKSFSCKRHGFWQAKLLAEAERKRVYPEWKSDEEVATEELMAIDLD